jgi:hypothetical protein
VDEFVCALNTDTELPCRALVTTDETRHSPTGCPLVCVYSTDPTQIGQEACPVATANGSAVGLIVPPGGIILYR